MIQQRDFWKRTRFEVKLNNTFKLLLQLHVYAMYVEQLEDIFGKLPKANDHSVILIVSIVVYN